MNNFFIKQIFCDFSCFLQFFLLKISIFTDYYQFFFYKSTWFCNKQSQSLNKNGMYHSTF